MTNLAIKKSVQFLQPTFWRVITDSFLPTWHLFWDIEYALENTPVAAFNKNENLGGKIENTPKNQCNNL